MTCQQMKLSHLSPFQRKEGCDRFGKVTRCDRLRDGSIEVEFVNVSEAARALHAKTFTYTVRKGGDKREVSLPVSVTAHRTKNFRKGVIFCTELRDTSDEEISEGLSSSGVTEAKRITVRKGGSTIPTDSIILTFDATELPSTVTVGYTRVRVRTYIPNPMRCFRCQRFGHTRTNCRNRPVCAKCSSPDHLDENCDAGTLRCANCGDSEKPHASYDRTCPSFVREREINAIKATRNVSFKEARDAYNQTHPTVSYAQKVKTSTSSKAALEDMSATQLLTLLKSFGLSVIASGAAPTSAAPAASTTLVAPVPSAVAQVPPSSSTSIPGEGRVFAAPTEADAAAADNDSDDGWTVVRGRRTAGRRSGSPPQPAAPGGPPSATTATSGRRSHVEETAVMAALRRTAEEKRARDARRARLVERAREARQSPSSERSSGTDQGVVGSAPPSPRGPTESSPAVSQSPSPMGPPPPLQRPRVPPPPLPSESSIGERPRGTPRSSPRPLEPPPAPARPRKRSLPLSGSPSESGTPRTRYKPQSHQGGGRSSSADGRLLQGDGAHARIRFGNDASEF